MATPKKQQITNCFVSECSWMVSKSSLNAACSPNRWDFAHSLIDRKLRLMSAFTVNWNKKAPIPIDKTHAMNRNAYANTMYWYVAAIKYTNGFCTSNGSLLNWNSKACQWNCSLQFEHIVFTIVESAFQKHHSSNPWWSTNSSIKRLLATAHIPVSFLRQSK